MLTYIYLKTINYHRLEPWTCKHGPDKSDDATVGKSIT